MNQRIPGPSLQISHLYRESHCFLEMSILQSLNCYLVSWVVESDLQSYVL